MKEETSCSGLSIFKPHGRTMRSEVRVISMILACWLFAIVGLQVYVYLLEVNYSPLLLDEPILFNLPIHFWLTGQLLPLWFILLCVAFNFWMDRHAPSASALNGSMRFRVKPDTGEED